MDGLAVPGSVARGRGRVFIYGLWVFIFLALGFEEVEKIEAWIAPIDPASGTMETALRLEGDVGGGPKKLSGPVFSDPVWYEGKLALSWTLWNEEAEGPLPARYVVGLWTMDGKAASEPVIAGKSRGTGMAGYPQHSLVSTPSGLFVSWVAINDKNSGCTFEHGIADSVKIVTVGADGSIKAADYACAEVITRVDTYRFGQRLFYSIGDDHIGSKVLTGCIPHYAGCENGYWESTNPLSRMEVTGGGYAIWYDELNENFKVKQRCFDVEIAEGVEKGGPDLTCGRYKSMDLQWMEEGLALVFETKEGGKHALPYLPGDHIPLKLLKKILAEKFAADDALWGGQSIAVARLKGRNIKVRVVGRDGIAAQSDE